MAFFTMRMTFIFLGLTLLLSSCGVENDGVTAFDSDLVIQEDSLILILKDIHLMDAAAKQNVIPNNSKILFKHQQYKAVLEKHGVSRTRFDTTIHVYTQHGEIFDELYDKLIEKILEEEKTQSPK